MLRNEIEAAVVRKGMTQEQAARILGITRVTFNRKLSGNGWTLKEARQLADTFNIKPSIFFEKEVN